jgi:hypothetical protein
MTSSEKFVILELRGTCEAPSTAPKGPPIKDRTALASTPVEDGQILPFSWIHCDALRRFIGSSIADLPETMRNFLYGRAMARLAAHELYHVLSGTQAHEDSGIAKAQFSSADLLASDLSFQEIAPTEAAQDYVGAPVFEDALGK